jgi:hypothetical protein
MEALTKEQKEKMVVEMRRIHKDRYGTKQAYAPDQDRYIDVLKRKSYDMEHMIEDLKFTMGNLHV